MYEGAELGSHLRNKILGMRGRRKSWRRRVLFRHACVFIV